MKKLLFYIGLLFLTLTSTQAQKSSKIVVEHADFFNKDDEKIPDAVLLQGNVRVRQDGVVFTCNKAYIFEKENYLKAFGEVQMCKEIRFFLTVNMPNIMAK